MTRPRSSVVSLSDTPWHHVVHRCVRRAFLCGEDRATGQKFEAFIALACRVTPGG
ncbi:hypothetical protein [Polaromonas sp.]|uniref:hypothetical protein n=1 Tax=Polaromonas sp. TaxID=1869339 RepID=UPI003566DFEC